MTERILVTPRSLTAEPHPDVERLRDHGYELVYAAAGTMPTEAELIRLVPGCVGWLAGIEPVSASVVEAASALRVISRNGIGVDNLPLALLARRGVAVRVAEGANARGVAELALGLMLSALRSIPRTDAAIKAGGWPRFRGREMRGRTVGIIGCGAVGRELVGLLAGLGAAVIGFDPRPGATTGFPDCFSPAGLDRLVATADIVSLHCPPPADGGPLLTRERLSRMKRGCILVNTARASLVDEAAVADLLDDGQLACYATDVFEVEPPAKDGIAAHPGVIATSHIGGFTGESVDRATRIAAENLLAVLRPQAEAARRPGPPGGR